MTNAKDVLEWMEWQEKRKPRTNEEWLRTLTTEQLADVLSDFYLMGVSHGINGMDITPRTKWVAWLKQPHTIKE